MLRERQWRAELLWCEKHAKGQTGDPDFLILGVVLSRWCLSCARRTKSSNEHRTSWVQAQDKSSTLSCVGQHGAHGVSAVLAHLGWFGTGSTQHQADTDCWEPSPATLHQALLMVPTSLLPSRAIARIVHTAAAATSHGQRSKYETSTPKSLHLENLT